MDARHPVPASVGGVTAAEYARLKQIVAGALACSEADRAAYLDAQCGSDAAAIGEVTSWIAAALRAADMYDAPALLIAGRPVTLDALGAVDAGSVAAGPGIGGWQADTHAERQSGFGGTARYRVRRHIGAGGMGIVYEVDDLLRQQVVALKTLRRRSAEDIYQLKREFRNLADVSHPNLVSLHDLVVDDRHCFFTMELIDGTSFVEHVRDVPAGPVRWDRVRRGLLELVSGVRALHHHGLQHRDIKPSNVLVTTEGRVVVLDFGLTSGRLRTDPGGREILGTPAYLAPEQCRGLVSEASDWYGVGAMLYHALIGRPPFEGSVREVVARKVSEDPAPIAVVAPGVPDDLARLCMALLARDPDARPSGADILTRLSTGMPAVGHEAAPPVFVGRESTLDLLAAAFAAVRAGGSVLVVIHGPSGIGKSALVQRFVDRRLGDGPALVLRSRCHEHESVPYNGLDSLVDGLTRHLAGLPAGERASAIPPDAVVLARLFPVMVTLGLDPPVEAGDPIRERRRAFAAFRELLVRLAGRQPLVLDIDDFHWADADSVRWLTDLLRPPLPPSVLVLVSFRSEELDAKPFLRSMLERVDVGERIALPLAPMTPEEAERLVATILPDRAERTRSAEIARASGGNPFLVDALARHVALGARGATATLDEMLARRLDGLPHEARLFLETLAVCGRPERPARIFEACGLHGDDRRLLARLRGAHLVRNSRSADRVELYHDRIRETLAAQVGPDEARRVHEVMARVLVSHGDDDPEALFEHYRATGRTSQAAGQAALAAEKAAQVLAFDLAVSFYRQALDLEPDGASRAAWSAGLASALENAGRPVEAAETCLDVVRHAADAPGAMEWQRKAAELFLVGGQIDRGLAVSETVLRAAGMRPLSGPLTALASLAARRLQLRVRGLDFTPRDPARMAPRDLLAIDVCWALSAGLAMVDPIRAAAFNARHLLKALAVGDPYRVARALALEAGFSVVGVGAGLERSLQFSGRAEALAGHIGHQYVAALTSLWAGIAAFLTGHWRRAAELCGRAVTTLRDECTGVIWELNMAHNFFLGGLHAQGELREVASRLPGLLHAARERGNAYLELELSTRMVLIFLAADEPDDAERRANDCIARWSHQGFQRQHYNHLLSRVQTALYRGRGGEAWDLMARHAPALRRSLFLRVQHTRIEAANLRARSALARASAGEDATRMRASALRDAARLEGERAGWALAFARLIRAIVAHQDGDDEDAKRGLSGAVDGFDAAEMQLYAAVCRRRLATLVGGDEGRALRAVSDRWMADQRVRRPDAMARLIAPGWPD